MSTRDSSIEPVMAWEPILAKLEPPVLLVSTHVGRGMYTLGEAVCERFPGPAGVGHFHVEQFLPGRAVMEDLKRYQWLTNYIPFVMNVIYRVPLFYYRKYARECFRSGSDLTNLKDAIARAKARTVLCISHRPAFWISNLKRRGGLDFQLWGLLGEYGNTLGWRYIFWDQMDGFLSPLDRRELTYPFPDKLQFHKIALPARKSFEQLRTTRGDTKCVLLVCGYWGQGPILRLVQQLMAEDDQLRLHVVCGDNVRVLEQVRSHVGSRQNVTVHGAVPSLVPFLREASCVITKPGISTLQEAYAAGRKIFFVKGIPVAEDNNARFAIRHFGAQWFSPKAFREWRRGSAERLGSHRPEAA
jgi:hypothetical protein